jgi:hypothetical protein
MIRAVKAQKKHLHSQVVVISHLSTGSSLNKSRKFRLLRIAAGYEATEAFYNLGEAEGYTDIDHAKTPIRPEC